MPAIMYLGDNVEQLTASIAADSIDLTVTSPPYDNLRDYHGGTFNLDALIPELWRVTKTGGVVVWNVADATVAGSETGTSFKQALAFLNYGWTLHDTMIYEKGNFSNPSRNRYHQIFEYMFVFSKGKPKTFNPICDKPLAYAAQERRGSFGKNTVRQADGSMLERPVSMTSATHGMRTNIWRMRTAGQERPGKAVEHPANMPSQMARDHILSWSNPGDVVLDPFAGCGTTGVQALALGRNFVGIELSPEYHALCLTSLGLNS